MRVINNFINEEKLNMTCKSIFRTLGILGFGVLLYFMYLHLSYNNVFIMDNAINIVAAHKILNGNIFLKSFCMTTINGIFTWILYTILGCIIAGFNEYAIYVEWAIVSVVLFYLIILLNKISKINVYITFCLFIVTFYTRDLIWEFLWGGHIELMTYIIGILILLQSIYNKSDSSNQQIIFLYLLIFLATFSDPMCVSLLVLPLVVVTLFRFFKYGKKLDLKISISSLIVAALSICLNKFLSAMGIWSYAGIYETKFCSLDNIFVNILDTIKLYFKMFSADFGGMKALSLLFICTLFGVGLLTIGLIIFIHNIKNFFKYDVVNQTLVLGILVHNAVFVVLDLYCGHPMRYIMPCAIYMLLLIARFDWEKFLLNVFNKLKSRILINLNIIKVILLLFFALVAVAKIPAINIKNEPIIQPIHNSLCDYCLKKNLKNGYGDHFISSPICVLSNGKIGLTSICCNEDTITMERWLSDHKLYNSPVNFVIVSGDGEGVNYVDKEKVIDVLGVPKEVDDVDNYSILIYDYDISKKVNCDYNVFKFGSQLGHNSEISHCIDKKLILNNNDMQFGPYAKLNKGKYKVTIIGENLSSGTFDVYSNKENKIFEINNVNVTPTKVTYEVQINKNVNDIEFRCYNNSNDDILINSLNATYESDK